MSDVSQGPGWWQASDGKWYPPEQAPSGAPAPAPAFGAPAAGGIATGPGGAQLAEWPIRFLGGIIDYWALYLIAGVVSQISFALASIFWLLAFAFAIYNGYLNGQTGQSVGKKLLGLKVISEETGQVIGGGMGIARYFAHIIDSAICGIGYLFPLWDSKKQTIADKLIKTVVVTGAPKHELNADILKG